jgi:hypothetical protein
MMIYNDSTKGISISVNIPRVTPEMIRLAEQSPNRGLVIECVAPKNNEGNDAD